MIATAAPAAPSAADLGINPTGERYFATRYNGRYRVFDGQPTEGHLAVEVAVCASRAKAEEKAAKLNAAGADDAARIEAEAVAARAAAEEARRQEAIRAAEAHAAEVAAAAAAAAEAKAAKPARTPRAPKAEGEVTTWIGKAMVEVVLTCARDTDPAAVSLAAKVAAKKPDSAEARTVRMTAAEVEFLSGLATEVENEAIERGDGKAARGARALRGRLS